MRPDDVAFLESIFREIVDALTPALRSAELALEVLAARRRPSARPPDVLLASLIDESRFTVHWNGARCDLGATVPFRLFRRLARSADRFLSIEALLDDVWGGDERSRALASGSACTSCPERGRVGARR